MSWTAAPGLRPAGCRGAWPVSCRSAACAGGLLAPACTRTRKGPSGRSCLGWLCASVPRLPGAWPDAC
eukprot:14419106-Alexandrium_andersonii.AAC.2